MDIANPCVVACVLLCLTAGAGGWLCPHCKNTEVLGFELGTWLHTVVVIYNISVPLFQVGPPGYFTHISITTPIVIASALKSYYI
jgi:hypothetical protein